MYSLTEAQNLVEKHVSELKFPDSPADLYDPVRYILSNGGKRVRPSLVILSCNVFNDDVSAAINPAMAIEIFHNFTLLHDDLMDFSEIRRGNLTVHRKWNDNIAILSGDAMSILANDYVSRVEGPILPDILRVFNKTAVEVCEGQMMDMDFENRENVSIEEYIRMIELKTSVLIAASMQLGALSGGASMEQSVQMYEFGRMLGIAFQLQDDLLDSFGDVKTFGKKIGNDILTNKKTFLMISALERTRGEDHKELSEWMKKEDFDPAKKISAVKKIFENERIPDLTKSKISEYFTASLTELDKIEVAGERKKVLRDFADNLMSRKV